MNTAVDALQTADLVSDSRTDEIRSIVDVLMKYEVGTRTRNIKLLEQVFHESALMSGYLGGNLLVGSLQPFFDFVANNEVSPDFVSSTSLISVTGNTACAKVFEDKLFGMSFVNNFQFLKVDGVWLIVSKLFHHD